MIKQPDTHTQPLPKGGVLDSNESDMYIPTSADKAVQSPSLGEGLGVGMGSRDCEGLKSLGSKTTCYRMDYAPDVLETFVNKHQGNDYWVRFNCPEFTSLCPKSLKLYLFSFRNHGDFHEDCVNIIMKDLIRLMDPKYIEVTGLFTPRGGISIYPYANYGRPGTKYERLAEERFARHE